jgi:hypothetical protein
MSRLMVVLALTAAVSPGIAQEVRVDYEHACNFSGYKTYHWAPQQAHFSDLPFSNQLMQERIVSFVEEALAAKGFKRVETGADLLVSYDVKIATEPQYTTYTDTTGLGWGSAFSTTESQAVSTAMLVVNMKDSRHKQLVFQGVSTTRVSSRAEKNARRLQKGINKMFEKYPPKD